MYKTKEFIAANSVWSSNTKNIGKAERKLAMQEDGNLVIYEAHNLPIWATMTFGKNNL